MSYQFYKVLHIIGLVLAAGGVGAIILQMQLSTERNFPKKKWALAVHGVGMLLIFVAGFGLMARTGMVGQDWPFWLNLKMGIWIFFAAAPSLAMRAPKARLWVWWVVPATLLVAIYSVVYKI